MSNGEVEWAKLTYCTSSLSCRRRKTMGSIGGNEGEHDGRQLSGDCIPMYNNDGELRPVRLLLRVLAHLVISSAISNLCIVNCYISMHECTHRWFASGQRVRDGYCRKEQTSWTFSRRCPTTRAKKVADGKTDDDIPLARWLR